jgi:hypothetical protein
MQLFALALMLSRDGLATKVLIDLSFSLPALAAGTAVGVIMFGRVNDALFRRIVLVVLFVAGLALLV